MPNENWYNQNTCREWSGCFDDAAKVYPNKMFCLSDPGIEAPRKRKKKKNGVEKTKHNRVQINVWTDPIKCYLGMRIMCMLPGSFVTWTKTKKKRIAYYRRQQTVNVDNYIRNKKANCNAHVRWHRVRTCATEIAPRLVCMLCDVIRWIHHNLCFICSAALQKAHREKSRQRAPDGCLDAKPLRI